MLWFLIAKFSSCQRVFPEVTDDNLSQIPEEEKQPWLFARQDAAPALTTISHNEFQYGGKEMELPSPSDLYSQSTLFAIV